MADAVITATTTQNPCETRGVWHEFTLPNGSPVEVLRVISLAIKPKEIVALLWPSGCGESTLLRILAVLIQPSRGDVLYHGEPLQGLDAVISVVFTAFACYPWMAVAE